MVHYRRTVIALAVMCGSQLGCLEGVYRPFSQRTRTQYPHPIIESDYAGEQVKDYTNRLRQLGRNRQEEPISQPVSLPVRAACPPVIPLGDGYRRGPTKGGVFSPKAPTRAVSIPPLLSATTSSAGPAQPKVKPTEESEPLPHKLTPDAIDDYITHVQARAAEDPDNVDLQLRARLLLLAVGKRADALRPIAALSEEENQQVASVLMMMAAVFNHKGSAPSPNQAANRLADLQVLRETLMQFADLQIPNMKLCKSVEGYGVYELFPSHTFPVGRNQPLLVYCELRNFLADKKNMDSYHTRLTVQTVLYDARGQLAQSQPEKSIEDISANRRSDFFLTYRFDLPNTLGAGDYTLKVTIKDLAANKAATKAVQITMEKPG